MARTDPAATRVAEYLRMLDAKDEVGIRAMLADDAQLVDEVTRRWVRGPDMIGAALRSIFSRLADVQSSAEDIHVMRWIDVEIETFVLHQVYELDGATTRVVAPTTLIWHRTPGGWRLALIQSIPTDGT